MLKSIETVILQIFAKNYKYNGSNERKSQQIGNRSNYGKVGQMSGHRHCDPMYQIRYQLELKVK